MLKRNIVFMILLAFGITMIVFSLAVAEEFDERSQNGWLGVYVQNVTKDLMEALDLQSGAGILVSDVVEDSPADQAGIKQEDVIIRFDGKKVLDASQFTELVRETPPNQQVELTIIRDGKEKKLTVTLGKQPKKKLSYEYELAVPSVKEKKIKPDVRVFRFFSGSRIGVKVQDLTEQLGDYFGVADGEGALITEIEEDMPAQEAGLKAGDVIVDVDGEKIEDTEELIDIISEKDEGDKVTIKVIRNRQPQSFVVEVQEGEEHTFDFSGLDKIKILREKPLSPEFEPSIPEAFWKEKYSPELKEEMKDLKEELQELKKELEELREKIR